MILLNNLSGLAILILSTVAIFMIIFWYIQKITKDECKQLKICLDKSINKAIEEIRINLDDNVERFKDHCNQTINKNSDNISTLIDQEIDKRLKRDD